MDIHPTIEKQAANEQRLAPAVIRKLSVLKPWLSVGHVALEYTFIIGAIVLSTMNVLLSCAQA